MSYLDEYRADAFDIVAYLHEKLNEYFEGIQNGDFNDLNSISEKYTFAHLIALFHASGTIPNGEELYKIFYNIVRECGRKHIAKKISLGKRIKVAFMVGSATEWPGQSLYNRLKNDDRFETYIIGLLDHSKDSSLVKTIYLDNKAYFENLGMDFRGVLSDNDEILDYDALGGCPDILINTKPYWTNTHKFHNLMNLPLNRINFYIPYGFYVADSIEGDYAKRAVYNMDFTNFQYAVFADSLINKEQYEKYELLNGENIIFSGYAKMDYFYDKHLYNDDTIRNLWAIPKEKTVSEVKRVIIAPHYSMGEDAMVNFSTFKSNYYFFLYLAEKYKNVSFILKPHPNLKSKVVSYGLFDSLLEYEEYLEKWNSLPNGKVVEEGFYLDLFETSDGMILDSASFMAEYLYVNKPVLFLTRPKQRFNELGKAILGGLYKTEGGNYVEIESFLKRIIDGNDSMKNKRETIFSKNLDYYSIKGKTAANTIFESILELISV